MKQLIEELILRKKISKMDFYSLIGMTPKGFSQSMENNSLKVATLIKIAEVLEVPVSSFFEKKPETENQEVMELLRENRQLRLEIERLKQTPNVGTNSVLPKLEKQKK